MTRKTLNLRVKAVLLHLFCTDALIALSESLYKDPLGRTNQTFQNHEIKTDLAKSFGFRRWDNCAYRIRCEEMRATWHSAPHGTG